MAGLIFITLALLAGTAFSSSPAAIEQYPFVVQTESFSSFYGTWTQSCVSTILNNYYVISAARCYIGAAGNRRVRAGSAQRHVDGVIHQVEWYRDHPSYGQGIGSDGDLTLVRLRSPFSFSQVIAPARIIVQNWETPAGLPVKHVGWRNTATGGVQAVLQEVELFSFNIGRCKEILSPVVVTPNMICTVPGEGSPDRCKGDTGGPILYQDVVIGLVSLAQSCGNQTLPVLNTAISPYTDWLVLNAV